MLSCRCRATSHSTATEFNLAVSRVAGGARARDALSQQAHSCAAHAPSPWHCHAATARTRARSVAVADRPGPLLGAEHVLVRHEVDAPAVCAVGAVKGHVGDVAGVQARKPARGKRALW